MKWQNQVVFPLLIINASGTFTGLFVYSPSIGLNNLIASITAQAGTDPYGNAYLAGITSYNESTGVMVNEQNGILTLGSIATPANRTPIAVDINGKVTASPPTGQPFTINGAANIINGLTVTGNLTTDSLAVTFQSVLTDTSFPVGIAGKSQIISNSGQLATTYGSGQQARLSTGRLAAVTPVTVTGASGVLFKDTIKANEAVIGATYKATAFGFGAWGNPVATVQFFARFGGADPGSSIGTSPIIDSTEFAAGALIRWEAEVLLTCVTTGVTAHWVANIKGCVTQTANNIIVGTAADNSVPFTGGTGSGTVTLDSTIDEPFGITAAVNGTGTLTAVSGFMERIA